MGGHPLLSASRKTNREWKANKAQVMLEILESKFEQNQSILKYFTQPFLIGRKSV